MIPNAVAFEWEFDQLDQEALLVLHAGPVGGPGGETFQIEVVTLAGLAARVARDKIVIGRHLLVVEAINQRRIEVFIEDRLRRISGETWNDVALKIGRLGYWEFEDYAKQSVSSLGCAGFYVHGAGSDRVLRTTVGLRMLGGPGTKSTLKPTLRRRRCRWPRPV